MWKEWRKSQANAHLYAVHILTNLKLDISSTPTSVDSLTLLFLFAINNRLSRCTCCLTLRHFFNILANTQTGQDTRPHFAQCCIRTWYIKQRAQTQGSFASMFIKGNVHIRYLKLRPKLQFLLVMNQNYLTTVYLVLFKQRNVVNIISDGGSQRSTRGRDTASSLSSRTVCSSNCRCLTVRNLDPIRPSRTSALSFFPRKYLICESELY